MELREKARENGNARLADTYLLIASAHEYKTLVPNYLQLCNLLFLNMLLIEAKIVYRSLQDKEQRKEQRRKYYKLKHKEGKMRELVRIKL